MKYLLNLLLLVTTIAASAQNASNSPEYTRAVEIGLGELQKGQCKPCLEAYERAFLISQHSVLSHLRAMLCAEWCKEDEKALAFANKALEIGWESTANILQKNQEYPELSTLRASASGKKLLERAFKAGKESGFNFELAQTLDALYEEDQKYRRLLGEFNAKYSKESAEYQQFMQEWLRSDSICLVKAEAIIAQYGYPGKTMVGMSRQDHVWAIIQHAPPAKQEQYFPLIDEAAQKGEMNKRAWALLVDRIKMNNGEPQIYGSQVVPDDATGGLKFYTIEDEPNVNKRRAEVGLKPLEEYAQRMGVDWKPK